MKFANKLTNITLVVVGVALVVVAFLLGKDSILPNAVVGLILLLRGSKTTPQSLTVCVIGLAAALLTVLVDIYLAHGGLLGNAISAIVLVLLGTIVLWDRINKQSNSTSKSPS